MLGRLQISNWGATGANAPANNTCPKQLYMSYQYETMRAVV